MPSVAEGDVFRVGGDELVFQFLTLVGSHFSEPPRIEYFWVSVDVRIVVHRVHCGRNEFAFRDERTIGEGEILERETCHGN